MDDLKEDKLSAEAEEASKDEKRSMELELIWDNLTAKDEKVLQEYFNNLGEYGGIPITKDNCDSLFENWSGTLSKEDIEDILKIKFN